MNSFNQIIVIDLTNPMVLSAGTHQASLFNFEFTQAPNRSSNGTATPFLAVGGLGLRPYFEILAVGDEQVFSGVTPFGSQTFGGEDTFELTSDQTVYAGVYQQGLSPYVRPIGLTGGSDGMSSFRRTGESLPGVGGSINGNAGNYVNRVYDFSVTVDDVGAVPEPISMATFSAPMLIGGVGMVWRRRRRKRTAM